MSNSVKAKFKELEDEIETLKGLGGLDLENKILYVERDDCPKLVGEQLEGLYDHFGHKFIAIRR